MLGFLFRGLTAEPARGALLFDALTAEARRPGWYVEGEVPDTLDGRFAVLATLTAITIGRLEREGEPGHAGSIALTERFIEVMESEHRELGLGDPTLGKTVRKLVGMLGKRVELWRDTPDLREATRESLYKNGVSDVARDYSATLLRSLRDRIAASPIDRLMNGDIA